MCTRIHDKFYYTIFSCKFSHNFEKIFHFSNTQIFKLSHNILLICEIDCIYKKSGIQNRFHGTHNEFGIHFFAFYNYFIASTSNLRNKRLRTKKKTYQKPFVSHLCVNTNISSFGHAMCGMKVEKENVANILLIIIE